MLADRGVDDAARKLYEQVLADESANSSERLCASRGLAALGYAAHVRASSSSASASAAAKIRSPQQRGSEGWDAAYQRDVKPLQNLIVPMLVVFAALLALVRFGTPVFVRPSTPGPRSYSRPARIGMQAAYWSGVVATAVGACLGVLAVAHATPWTSHTPTWLGIVALVGVLLELAMGLVLFTFVGRDPGRRFWISYPIVAAAGVAWALVLRDPDRLQARPWLLAQAALAAAFGVVLASRVRGLTSRVRIEGRTETGSDNAAAADRVRLRIQALGSHPAKGLEVPQQTDLTKLPDDAVALLPDGQLAKAIFRVVQTFLPTSPWRVTVTDLGEDRLGVTVQRNGFAVESAVVHAAELGVRPAAGADESKPASGTGADKPKLPKSALDTGAAAFVLCVLAERYHYLNEGLAGATRWESIAAQAAAADPSMKLTEQVERQLLGHAINVDPDNIAAQLAYYHGQYRKPDSLDEARKYAEALTRIAKQTADLGITVNPDSVTADRSEPGWKALQLRILYNLAVAWFNYYLLSRAAAEETQRRERIAAWDNAHSAATAVRGQLPVLPSKDLEGLVEELRSAVDFTLGTLEREHRQDKLQPWLRVRLRKPHTPDRDALTRLISTDTSYDRACYQVAARDEDAALRDLEVAATRPDVSSWARTDPSMTWLREQMEKPEARRQFRRIVGEAPPSEFVQLPPWKSSAEKLTAHGISSAADLRATSQAWLSKQLGISPAVARRWHAAAEVALTTTADGKPLPVSVVFLLFKAGIVQRQELIHRLCNREELAEALDKAANTYDVDVPTVDEIGQWRPPTSTGLWWLP